MSEKTVIFKIKRQDNPTSRPYYNTFKITLEETANINIVLMTIRENPVTIEGMKVPPVSWEFSCMEEVCGACTLLINKKPRQGCSTLLKDLPPVTTLEPLTKFPVIRDLIVDRSKMFDALKKVKAWVNIEGTYSMGAGLNIPPKIQEEAYIYSRCMTCGCCLEVCPQYNEKSRFMGAAAIGQVHLMNLHPVGKNHAGERLEMLLEEGGIGECGNAQNCVKVCPKEIPLTSAIAKVNAQVNKYLLSKILKS
ncbi:MAG: succinate dehydrogenase iron-sulfur subunit [Planctomycetota bacterium]